MAGLNMNVPYAPVAQGASYTPQAGKWQTNADIMASDAQAVDARIEMSKRQSAPLVTGLAGRFRSLWEAARDHKQRMVEPRLLACLLARKGEYSSSQKAQIAKAGEPEIFLMLTDEKCTNLESWLHDIFDLPEELPFGAKDTPIPELDPILQQALAEQAQAQVEEAATALLGIEIAEGRIVNEQAAAQRLQALMAEQMKDIEDELRDILHEEAKKETEDILRAVKDVAEESGWMDQLLESISDFATYPNSFLKGPFQVGKTGLQWTEGKATLVDEVATSWSSPSPWDMFPGPDNTTCQDGYLIERHYLTTKGLTDLIGVDGYDADAIRAVIRDHSGGGLRSSWLDSTNESERQRLEGRDRITSNPEPLIPALQIWADIPGYMLADFGMPGESIPDYSKHYPIEAWMIGSYIIKCVMNPSPNGKRPYYSAGFREIKGSFWKRALPEVISDSQSQCNVIGRSMAANVALSAGPQVGVDVGAIPPGEKIEQMFPRKIWQFDLKNYMGGGSGSRQPLWFFQADLLVEPLMRTYEFWSNEADNKSGIPRYATGAQGGQQGALSTSSGMAMMLSNATKGIKKVAKNIDRKQIEPSVQRMLEDILMSGELQGYKGDIKIQAKGSNANLQKEATQIRRNEAMNSLKTDPTAQRIIGIEGYANLLRDYYKDLGFTNVVPGERELKLNLRQEEFAMQQQQMALAAGPQQGALPETDASGAKQGGADMNLMQGGV